MARWRTGRTVGRTIYIQIADDPRKGDVLIGVMDTPELATLVVNAVNRIEDEAGALVLLLEVAERAKDVCRPVGVGPTRKSLERLDTALEKAIKGGALSRYQPRAFLGGDSG